MTGAETLAGIAVKVFKEQVQVAPVRIVPVVTLLAMPRPPAFFVRQEDGTQTPADLAGYLVQRHLAPGTGRAFDLKLVAVKVMIAFQGLDQKIIDREPDWPAPVGVAAKHAGVGFARHIRHALLGAG